MRSLSVTTISRTSSRPQLRSTSGIESSSSGVSQTPRGWRKMWLNIWQALPTTGVYTIGRNSIAFSTSSR